MSDEITNSDWLWDHQFSPIHQKCKATKSHNEILKHIKITFTRELQLEVYTPSLNTLTNTKLKYPEKCPTALTDREVGRRTLTIEIVIHFYCSYSLHDQSPSNLSSLVWPLHDPAKKHPPHSRARFHQCPPWVYYVCLEGTKRSLQAHWQ